MGSSALGSPERESILSCSFLSKKSKTALKFKYHNSRKEFQLILKAETIYVYWPSKCALTVCGIPKNFLLLSFYVEESVVRKIQNLHINETSKGNTDWYQKSCRESSRESQNIVDGVPKVTNRRRRRGATITASCESITLGYIELEMQDKQEGDKRSCIQDAFINAGFLLDIDISTELYKEVAPKRTVNTKLCEILKSRAIANNFSVRKQSHVPGEKGDKEWILLRCRQKTGLYIVWCTVEYTKGKTEKHAFVFDSNFSSWKGNKYYGAIIDNRKYSNFRAFEKRDLIDIKTTRESLSAYFRGVTRILDWFQIDRKIK